MGIMESIHCLSSFGMIEKEEVVIICSEQKIYEIRKEIEGTNFYVPFDDFNPNKPMKVFWCGVTYIFAKDIKLVKL